MSKITNDCLTRSGTGCFIAVPIWQQWASRVKCYQLLQCHRFFATLQCSVVFCRWVWRTFSCQRWAVCSVTSCWLAADHQGNNNALISSIFFMTSLTVTRDNDLTVHEVVNLCVWRTAHTNCQSFRYVSAYIYSVSPKKSPLRFFKFFPKWLGIFNQFFTHLLHHHFYTRVQIFI